MIDNFRSNININRRKNSKIKAPIVQASGDSKPLVGDGVRVLPSSSKRATVTENVFGSHAKKLENNADDSDRRIQIGTHTPRVRAVSGDAARILIVGQISYSVVHTSIYMFGLRFWNVATPYFILMWLLEEIPNAYNLAICIASQIDPAIPSNVSSSTTQLQTILYIWKPVIRVLAVVVLILDLLPLGFGCYIWYYGDGEKDQAIGQSTMVQSMANALPYIYSLVLLYLSLQYIQKDLGMQFAGYRAPQHQSVQAENGGRRALRAEHWSRLSQDEDTVQEEYSRRVATTDDEDDEDRPTTGKMSSL